MEFKTLKTEQKGHIFIIKYSYPPKNFIIIRFFYELRILMRKLEKDPSVRVVILTGDNKEYFISHSDMDEIIEMVGGNANIPKSLFPFITKAVSGLNKVFRRFPLLEDRFLSSADEKIIVRNGLLITMRLFDEIQHSSKITIAAINGICIGGGNELAMCFDFRLMAIGDEIVIGQPEILIGMIPGYGGTQRMARIIGPAKTLEIQLSGRVLNAVEAENIGLIYKALPADIFESEVLKFAERLAKRVPEAVKSLKKAVFKAGEQPLEKGLFTELHETLHTLTRKDEIKLLKRYSKIIKAELQKPDNEQRKPQEILNLIMDGNLLQD